MRKIALTSAIGLMAISCACGASRASDCDFFQEQIDNLKAACASGSYCADLEAFKQRARSEGCLANEVPPPVTVVRPPPPKPQPPPTPRKDNCAAIPTDLESYKMAVALKYSAKLRALTEGLELLRRQRSELENTFNFDIGAPGSIRSSITYIAAITKTATDLINDVLAYLPEGKLGNSLYKLGKWKLSSRQAYEAITKGKLINDAVSEDALQAAIDVTLEAATINPAIATAKLLNDLQKNGRELAETPEKFKTAREDYLKAVDLLDGQISNIAKKISEAKAASVQSGGEALLKRYTEIRSMCFSADAGGPELRPLQ